MPEDKPYGNVRYADPKNYKYPIDTPKHIRAAKSYFAMPRNRAKYTPEEQEHIQKRIDAAMNKLHSLSKAASDKIALDQTISDAPFVDRAINWAKDFKENPRSKIPYHKPTAEELAAYKDLSQVLRMGANMHKQKAFREALKAQGGEPMNRLQLLATNFIADHPTISAHYSLNPKFYNRLGNLAGVGAGVMAYTKIHKPDTIAQKAVKLISKNKGKAGLALLGTAAIGGAMHSSKTASEKVALTGDYIGRATDMDILRAITDPQSRTIASTILRSNALAERNFRHRATKSVHGDQAIKAIKRILGIK